MWHLRSWIPNWCVSVDICRYPLPPSLLPHLSMHEEAQCERDPHGPVSKLLFTAHGSGGGVVVGGLCRWETHEGSRPRGVWKCPEHHRGLVARPLASPGAAGGVRGGQVWRWAAGCSGVGSGRSGVRGTSSRLSGFILFPLSLSTLREEEVEEHFSEIIVNHLHCEYFSTEVILKSSEPPSLFLAKLPKSQNFKILHSKKNPTVNLH